MGRDIYSCFVDLDGVQYGTIIQSILISKAVIRIDQQISEEAPFRRGGQGCLQSPVLLRIYVKQQFNETFDEIKEGLPGNEEIVINAFNKMSNASSPVSRSEQEY